MSDVEETITRPWLCDRCGELNNAMICARCGVDAPISVYIEEDQSPARHAPAWGQAGLKNIPRSCSIGIAIFFLAYLVFMVGVPFWHIARELWDWIQSLFP